MAYSSGSLIFEAALEAMPFDVQSNWPKTALRILWLNEGLEAAQALTGHFRQRKAITFLSVSYSELTGVNPALFKLISVHLDNEQMSVVPYETILHYRDTSASLGSGVYVFAANPYPGETVGSVRFECYPTGPASPGISPMFYYETTPTVITGLEDTVYMPSEIMVNYIKMKIAESRKPEKTAFFHGQFINACNISSRTASVSKTGGMYGDTTGFIANIS